MAGKEKIIGIDLGTSNSAASVLQAGRPIIIPSAEGASLYGKAFPSFVAFTKDGNVLVGEPARRQAISNPEGTVYAAKRKMGTSFPMPIFLKFVRLFRFKLRSLCHNRIVLSRHNPLELARHPDSNTFIHGVQ